MRVPLLLAITDPAWEAELVGAIGDHPTLEVARRCLDVADLLAAAAAGLGRAAVVSADLHRFDRDSLTRLAVAGVVVVGAVHPDDDAAERRLRQWGVNHLVAVGAGVEEVASSVLTSLTDPPVDRQWDYSQPRPEAVPDGWSTRPATSAEPKHASDPGPVLAVWGPVGSPGRSTIALTLADEFARMAGSAVIVDADVYGASIAPLLGLLDESPGLAAACRLANAGRLDVPALADLTLGLKSGLRVLTGIARPDRWIELRPSAVSATLELTRRLGAAVFVDCSFCLEQDEELSFDTAAPRRNGATLAALDAADVIVAVAAADPIGLQRFIRGLTDLKETLPDAVVRVVVNRSRKGAVPGDPRREIAGALKRYAGIDDVWFLPDDPSSCDAAVTGGRTLAEVSAGSPLRQAIAGLAAELGARHAGLTARSSSRSRRSRGRRASVDAGVAAS